MSPLDQSLRKAHKTTRPIQITKPSQIQMVGDSPSRYSNTYQGPTKMPSNTSHARQLRPHPIPVSSVPLILPHRQTGVGQHDLDNRHSPTSPNQCSQYRSETHPHGNPPHVYSRRQLIPLPPQHGNPGEWSEASALFFTTRTLLRSTEVASALQIAHQDRTCILLPCRRIPELKLG